MAGSLLNFSSYDSLGFHNPQNTCTFTGNIDPTKRHCTVLICYILLSADQGRATPCSLSIQQYFWDPFGCPISLQRPAPLPCRYPKTPMHTALPKKLWLLPNQGPLRQKSQVALKHDLGKQSYSISAYRTDTGMPFYKIVIISWNINIKITTLFLRFPNVRHLKYIWLTWVNGSLSSEENDAICFIVLPQQIYIINLRIILHKVSYLLRYKIITYIFAQIAPENLYMIVPSIYNVNL